MDSQKPDFESYEEKIDWIFWTGRHHSEEIKRFRAQGNPAAMAKQIAEFEADVTTALKMGVSCPTTLMSLVHLAVEPKRRLEWLQITYTRVMENVEDEECSEQQARSCCEAAWLQREMAVLHERAGHHAAARRCYDDAVDLSLRAGDLAYTHFMSQCRGFTDGDARPIFPRLIEDLDRIGNNAQPS